MRLIGSAGQLRFDRMYCASGTIATGGTSQLVLPERQSTSYLVFQNISDTDMYLEFGSARATATLTSGAVSSCSITNGGFGFTVAPVVTFLGGGNTGWNMNDASFLGCGQPTYPSPSDFAKGRAVLTAGVVSSITVDHGGVSYAKAPYVFIHNSRKDPFGCADPNYGSNKSGIFLPGNTANSTWQSGTTCCTDAIAVYCATTGKAFTCFWLD